MKTNFYFTSIIFCLLLSSCSKDNTSDSIPKSEFEQKLIDIGIEDTKGLSERGPNEKSESTLHFNTVEEFNQYRRDSKIRILDTTPSKFDFTNFKEITDANKSLNGQRIFVSQDATIIFPAGTCPPPILAPTENCDQSGGGGGGSHCGPKTNIYHKKEKKLPGTFNVIVNVKKDPNTGKESLEVESEWTGSSSATGTKYKEVSQNVTHVGGGFYDYTFVGRVERTTNVSIGMEIIDVGLNIEDSYLVTIKGYYSACGNNGGGAGGIEKVLAEASKD